MSNVGYGIPWRIDGPLPSPPVRGLLPAAAAPAAGVTIVDDVDAEGLERWINSVALMPYVSGPGQVWNACAVASEAVEKDRGPQLPLPQFGAMTLVVPITCTAYQVPDQAAFRARAALVLDATSSYLMAKEFLTGDELPANPHLSDGNGTFPNLDAPTSVINALALLEGEIAKSGQLGIVHMSPQAATFLRNYYVIDDKTGVLRTISGTVVIPDAGYGEGATPAGGHAAPGPNQEWMYATGTIEIRRSVLFVVPDDVSQALDRGTGATQDVPNSITYRAERYAIVDWDTQVQAAVLADRCSTTC